MPARSTPSPDGNALGRAGRAACERLWAERTDDAFWEGELAPSAVSTATAVIALCLSDRAGVAEAKGSGAMRASGVAWLRRTQNEDGGWGDTPVSRSNLTTTALTLCALKLEGEDDARARGEAYLESLGGFPALVKRYGGDRTFSVPVLTVGAAAGYVDFRDVPALPFEISLIPRGLMGAVGIQVVSYALPALIAMGVCRYRRRPPWNPLRRVVRWMAERRALDKMLALQPESGGFLEAIPLTSFVCAALVTAGHADHEVIRRGLTFIRSLHREDGSWPIDANLSVWNTGLAAQALVAFDPDARRRLDATRDWLLARQRQDVAVFTDADPGGWAWTHLPGGVPDGDDTSQALLTLRRLGVAADHPALRKGRDWLIGLQNRDGGIPTFTRGWTSLPFDRSCVDITAHALRAFAALGEPADGQPVRAALRYLREERTPEGWSALWFGNEGESQQRNLTYATSQVLDALLDWELGGEDDADFAVKTLLDMQNEDGGWGGARGLPSTAEETAFAVLALARVEAGRAAALRGAAWLVDRQTADGTWDASPIGLYFARLWYSEKLYPLVFGLRALAAVGRLRGADAAGRERAQTAEACPA